MQADITIALKAENPARNVRRAWRAEAGTDLFGVWLVRYMRSKDTSPAAPRSAWLGLILVARGILHRLDVAWWIASAAWRKRAGVPVELKVATSFCAIRS